MKKKGLILATVLVLVASLLVLPACAPAAEEVEEVKEVNEIGYLTGPWGDLTANPVAAAEILNTYNPDVRVSVVKSAGSEMNTMMAADMPRNSILYHTTSMDFIAGYWGLPPWEEAYPNQSVLLSYGHSQGYMMYLTWDKNIQNMSDMAGKTLAVLPMPSLQNPFTFYILDALGIRDQVEVVNLDFGPLEDALRDKTVDAMMYYVLGPPGEEGLPGSGEEALFALNNEMYTVSVPEDVLKPAAASLQAGFGVRTAQPNVYLPLDTKEIWVHTPQFSILSSRADMDFDLVYGIVKTIIEHSDEFAERVPPRGRLFTPELAVSAMAFAHESMIHPGAVKYFKEANLWDVYLQARAEHVALVGE